MKIPKKIKLKILDVVADATMQTLHDIFPNYDQWGPPDTWDKDEKEIFDLISMYEQRVVKNIESIISNYNCGGK